ncbi:MAG TPA: glycosyltransferase, partial [Candidatus Saccharimonadales bacterium]|nr:glycosyltransferase [Candidatus Saccharimonadales bacterium]
MNNLSLENKDSRWIVLVGGGTGGHVVPLKNIAEQIFKQKPGSKILVITDRGYKKRSEQIFKELVSEYKNNLLLKHVSGGRFRRYSRSRFRELIDIRTQALNLRDLFKSIIGIIQSKLISIKYPPEVVFCKGGTGSLEYCFANRKKASILVHDSDSRPGLTNKIVGRWAVKTLTGMPQSVDEVDRLSKNFVGVPVNSDFKKFSNKITQEIKSELLIDQKVKTVLITGGSLGARKINELVFCTISYLNKLNILVIHQTGSSDDSKKAKEIKKSLNNPKLYRPF